MNELLNILEKSKMGDFFESIKNYGKIYGPVKDSGKAHTFKQVTGFKELDLEYTRTMIPPKKYFIHPEEVIFTFNIEEEEYFEPPNIDANMVLFGVHPCDINAMNLLSRVFMKELPDKYYLERRRNSVIIGVSCIPDDYCFCKSTGTSFVQEGYELFLNDIGEKYLVRIGSLKGKKIIKKFPNLFGKATLDDIRAFKNKEKIRLASFTRELNMQGLQDLLDISFDDSLWDEYGKMCLSCGNCNLVCPRCRCYDVQDYINLGMTSGERVRTWSSCMLKEHGLVTGGLNFRPTSKERIRNRFNCKGSLREGMTNCVGCGRCTVFCPAKIDFVEIMKKVRGEI